MTVMMWVSDTGYMYLAGSPLQLGFVSVDRCRADLPECKNAGHAGLTSVPKVLRAFLCRIVSHEWDVTHCVLPKPGVVLRGVGQPANW